jgi:copper homeostasis protein
MNIKLEVCSGSLVSALNAQAGGAHRVELCDNLNEGGTTPSPGTIILAKKHLHIPVFVLIRPRTGDFIYSDIEFDVMRQDILFCKEHRAEGVVLGVLKADGSVDIERTGELVELARPMQVTFHRAFDMAADPFKALEDIVSLGIDRVLTSGQATSALAGADLIEQLNIRANTRVIIMPGGGITEGNAIGLMEKTGAAEVHASLRSPVNSQMVYRKDALSMGKPGAEEYSRMETDAKRVARLISNLR